MCKQLFLAMSLTLLTAIAFAETCPTVNSIKQNTLTGWKLFDSDDGRPLSAKRETQYRQGVLEFALAEYKDANKSGSIHCYYRDRTGSNLEAYLAKDNFMPKVANNYWYEVSGFKHCAAGMSKCEFQRNLKDNDQLAKR